MSGIYHGAVDAYQEVSVESAAAYANPHQLITMLMEGALERIALAKGALLKEDMQAKGQSISNAITIIDGLRGCLDYDKGGSLAENLSDLYDYMMRRLLKANLDNDVRMLDEVARLMVEIKGAWDSISGEVIALSVDDKH